MNVTVPGRLVLMLWAIAVVLMGAAPGARGEEAAARERWYVVEMQGQRAGSMHDRMSVNDAGQKVTQTRIDFKLARLGMEIAISLATEFVETAEGEAVSMASTQNMGMGEVRQQYVFGPDTVTITTTQNGRSTERTAPRPAGQWLTPAEIRQFVSKRLEAGADEITYVSIDPSTGLVPITVTHKVLERTTVEALGKKVPAIKWTTSQSVMPGMDSTEYVDERGVPIRSEVNLGGIAMTVLAADRELATSPFSGPELMGSTLVKPDRDITEPRGLRRATYRLSVTSGSMPELPDAAAQDVERIDDASVLVRVDADNPAEAGALDADALALLTARSTNTDTTDPKVLELVDQALKELPEGATAAQQAEAMRRFVHGFIDAKNLGVGFATASEVARTREGDCSEHAVLLVAMLRAAGIPARGVSGLLYVDQFHDQERVFGYHMWAQALLELGGVQRWVDLDPVLPGEVAFDATHIALSVSDLSDDDTLNSMVPLATVLGRLKIEVKEAVE